MNKITEPFFAYLIIERMLYNATSYFRSFFVFVSRVFRIKVDRFQNYENSRLAMPVCARRVGDGL